MYIDLLSGNLPGFSPIPDRVSDGRDEPGAPLNRFRGADEKHAAHGSADKSHKERRRAESLAGARPSSPENPY